jgi:hypothetical protein
MSETIDLNAVSRTLQTWLKQSGQPVLVFDKVKDANVTVPPDSAAAPDGLLPVLLVAGEALWREATGKGFSLDILADPEALLGYRVVGIGGGSFATIMLSMMEATAQATRHDAVFINDLGTLWQGVTERLNQKNGRPGHEISFSTGATP